MFKKYKDQVAAVIMEPVIGQRQICTYLSKDKNKRRRFAKPCKGCNQIKTLKKIRSLAHKNGALFILDECISGFRFNLGGAQNYFGVDADLSVDVDLGVDANVHRDLDTDVDVDVEVVELG